MSDSLQDRVRAAVPIIDGDANIWSLFRDPDLYREVLAEMAKPFAGKITHVLGVESRGFILGQAMALQMDLPFVGVRKDTGFFPGVTVDNFSSPDYRGNRHRLRIQADALGDGDVCLLADDWIETGNQAMAVKGIVETLGAEFYGVATIVDQVKSPRREQLGVFCGIISNSELFAGREQRDYQTEAAGEP